MWSPQQCGLIGFHRSRTRRQTSQSALEPGWGKASRGGRWGPSIRPKQLGTAVDRSGLGCLAHRLGPSGRNEDRLGAEPSGVPLIQREVADVSLPWPAPQGLSLTAWPASLLRQQPLSPAPPWPSHKSSSPRATITKNHRPVYQQHTFILSQGSLEVEVKVSAGMVPLRALREACVPGLSYSCK